VIQIINFGQILTLLLNSYICTVASESDARFKINAKNGKTLLIFIKIHIKNNY